LLKKSSLITSSVAVFPNYWFWHSIGKLKLKFEYMKNLILLLMAFFVIATNANAQKKKSKTKKKAVAAKVITVTPPTKVDAMFNARFTKMGDITDKKWSKNYSGNYIVKYKNADGLNQMVEYKADGNFVKSDVEMNVSNIPENLRTAIATQYPGAEFKSVHYMETGSLKPYYKTTVTVDGTDKNLLVSEDGTVTDAS